MLTDRHTTKLTTTQSSIEGQHLRQGDKGSTLNEEGPRGRERVRVEVCQYWVVEAA